MHGGPTLGGGSGVRGVRVCFYDRANAAEGCCVLTRILLPRTWRRVKHCTARANGFIGSQWREGIRGTLCVQEKEDDSCKTHVPLHSINNQLPNGECREDFLGNARDKNCHQGFNSSGLARTRKKLSSRRHILQPPFGFYNTNNCCCCGLLQNHHNQKASIHWVSWRH